MGDTNSKDPIRRAGREPARKGASFFRRRPGLQSPNEALQPEAAPPPPVAGPPSGQHSSFLSSFSGFLSFLLVVGIGVVFAAAFVQEKLSAPGPLQSDKILMIAPGSTVKEILAELDREGVIDSPLLVNLVLSVERKRGNLRAGEYLFHQRVSAQEVIDTLVSGKQVLHSITIPEGLTTEQILDRLRGSDVLSGKIHETPKEGSLLPETYDVTRGTPRDALIREMEKDDQDTVRRIWNQREPGLPLKSSADLVTLASIVEKETGKADERPRVAEVFLNRLAKGMRLQSDPTVVYGLVGGKGTLGRPISKSEVEKPTPYNTYVINGLPPGPISNPGVAALEAVANPSHTKDLYFVADGTGGHAFAKTFAQHEKNVARWRQIEKAMRETSPSIDIDHAPASVVPTPAGSRSISPAHPERHSRNETIAVPIYGAVPTPRPPSASAQQALEGFASFANVAPDLTGRDSRASVRKGLRARADRLPSSASAFTNFSMGQTLDTTGITIRGATTRLDGSSILDGPVDSSSADTVDSAAPPPPATVIPPPARAAEGARMAQYGVLSRPDDMRTNSAAGTAATNAARPATSAPSEAHGAPVYDASEGTPLDPLLLKNWDLNSPKTVPFLPAVPASQ